MEINRMSISAQRVPLQDADKISSLSPYPGWWYCNIDCLHNKVTNAPRTYAVNSNFSSFNGNSAKEPSVFAAYDPSFGLRVVLRTLSKAGCRGGVGWETLLRGSWTIVFCQPRAEWENPPTREKRSRRRYQSMARRSASLQNVAAASCSVATHEACLLFLSPTSLFLFVWLGI